MACQRVYKKAKFLQAFIIKIINKFETFSIVQCNQLSARFISRFNCYGVFVLALTIKSDEMF